jgi:hypothetical protein
VEVGFATDVTRGSSFSPLVNFASQRAFGTSKPGNKCPVMVIDWHKYAICSVLTGTNLIVSGTLPGAHIYTIDGWDSLGRLDEIKYIENNTWVCRNTRFISSVEHDISQVSAANE